MCLRAWICALLVGVGVGVGVGIAGVPLAGANTQKRRAPAPVLKVDFTRIAGSHLIGSGRYVYV